MDKYIDYYNDSKKVTYHEQTDISNILKLRAVLKTLPDFCKDWIRLLLPKHEFPMRMISESFFSFSWMKILPLRTIP
jgi:hypothetical protein